MRFMIFRKDLDAAIKIARILDNAHIKYKR